MSKPWMIVPISTALEKCEELKKVAEHFDLIVVKDEDVEIVAGIVERMRRKMKIDIQVLGKHSVEGVGTILSCHIPKVENLGDLIGLHVEYNGQTYEVRKVETSQPNPKNLYGLVVRLIAPVAQIDGATVS